MFVRAAALTCSLALVGCGSDFARPATDSAPIQEKRATPFLAPFATGTAGPTDASSEVLSPHCADATRCPSFLSFSRVTAPGRQFIRSGTWDGADRVIVGWSSEPILLPSMSIDEGDYVAHFGGERDSWSLPIRGFLSLSPQSLLSAPGRVALGANGSATFAVDGRPLSRASFVLLDAHTGNIEWSQGSDFFSMVNAAALRDDVAAYLLSSDPEFGTFPATLVVNDFAGNLRWSRALAGVSDPFRGDFAANALTLIGDNELLLSGQSFGPLTIDGVPVSSENRAPALLGFALDNGSVTRFAEVSGAAVGVFTQTRRVNRGFASVLVVEWGSGTFGETTVSTEVRNGTERAQPYLIQMNDDLTARHVTRLPLCSTGALSAGADGTLYVAGAPKWTEHGCSGASVLAVSSDGSLKWNWVLDEGARLPYGDPAWAEIQAMRVEGGTLQLLGNYSGAVVTPLDNFVSDDWDTFQAEIRVP